MPIFDTCDDSVSKLATELLNSDDMHKNTVEAKVKIDFLFAYPKEGSDKPALMLHGCRALGICRIVNLKDRVKGNAEVEITLDGTHWTTAGDMERRALLEHELVHIDVQVDASGTIKKDDADRPIIKCRKHDFEFGLFNCIAAKYGKHSPECQYMNHMIEEAGQFLLPGIAMDKAA